MGADIKLVLTSRGAKAMEAYAREAARGFGWQAVDARFGIACIEGPDTPLLTIWEALSADVAPRSVTIPFHQDEIVGYGTGHEMDAMHVRITREIYVETSKFTAWPRWSGVVCERGHSSAAPKG